MTAKEYLENNPQSEDDLQVQLMYYCRIMSGKYPELELLYHIPNEGKRSRTTGAKQVKMGLKTGVPDLCLPVARKGFHGLYIELKTVKGKPRESQLQWIHRLNEQGYRAVICYGYDDAVKTISDYLK